MLINVNTGYGYYTNADGWAVAKAQLKPGEHFLAEGYTYHEVNNQAELERVHLYEDSAAVELRINEAKIQAEIRRAAIERLKAAGELPAEFKDSRDKS